MQNRLATGDLDRLRPSDDDQHTSWSGSFIKNGIFLSYVLGISTLMMMVNAVLCLSVFSLFTIFGPPEITENRQLAPYIGQLFFFIVPVCLTILEWNLLDRLNRLFRRRV